MKPFAAARYAKTVAFALCVGTLLASCGEARDPASSSSTSSAAPTPVSELSSAPSYSSDTAEVSSEPVSSAVSESPSSNPSEEPKIRFSPLSVSPDNPDINQKMLEVSFVAEGELSRIARVLDKAEKGEKVVLGFIGGSITEGMSASMEINRYANRVADWFRKTYPKAEVESVNAGIGSTGSIIASGRLEEDLLSKKPDLVFVDFAVNDGTGELEQEAYEGLVYRILTSEKRPGVVLLFMTRSDGGSSQDVQIPIGRKFNLPMISYRNAVALGVGEKRFAWRDISPDHVHPGNRGHALLASLIIHRLELVRQNLSEIERTDKTVPQSKSRFASLKLRNSQNFKPKSLGSFKPASEQYPNASLSKGWTASAPGGAFTFETTSKVVVLVYKRSVANPGAKLIVKVNGKEKTVIDSDFKNGFGEYADYVTIVDRGTTEKRKIELIYAKDSPEKSTFMLLGIIE